MMRQCDLQHVHRVYMKYTRGTCQVWITNETGWNEISKEQTLTEYPPRSADHPSVQLQVEIIINREQPVTTKNFHQAIRTFCQHANST